MPILNYVEKAPTASVSEKGERTYKRRFFVASSEPVIPPYVWTLPGAPPINRYDPYPGDIGALAKTLDVADVQDSVGYFYEFTYSYDSKSFDQGNSKLDPNKTDQSQQSQPGQPPQDWPITVDYDSVNLTRLLAPKDIAGVAVVNSANQPFNPPPSVPCANRTISLSTKRIVLPGWIGPKQALYVDSVNDAEWTLLPDTIFEETFAPKTVKVNKFSAKASNQNGIYLFDINVVLEIAIRKPWNPVLVLDAGTLERDHGDPALPPKPILDKKTGQPIQSPLPLGGNGIPLEWNAPDFFYLPFQGYFETNFNNLFI